MATLVADRVNIEEMGRAAKMASRKLATRTSDTKNAAQTAGRLHELYPDRTDFALLYATRLKDVGRTAGTEARPTLNVAA